MDLDAIFESSTAPVRKLEGYPSFATLFGTVPKQLEIRRGLHDFLLILSSVRKQVFTLIKEITV